MVFSRQNLIRDMIKDNDEYILSQKDVIGVGIGYKKINGINTGEECITIFVKKKLPLEQINAENVIPSTYLGIKTDVIQMGVLKTLSLTSKVRPLVYGCSISPVNEKIAGTAGCLVYDNKGYYILSNNHALAKGNYNPIGTPIIQPSLGHRGDLIKDVVAYLDRFVPIKYPSNIKGVPKPANYVDAAIAKLISREITTKFIHQIGVLKGTTNPVINLTVQNTSQRSGYVKSKIINIGANFSVDFNGINCLFQNTIVTNYGGKSGDSGAVLVDMFNNAIGLLFAGSEKEGLSVYCPITQVLNDLNVNLVTG